jgi:uncharacterized protein (TIGR04141 family)
MSQLPRSSRQRTRRGTLYRLQGIGGDLDGAFDCFDAAYLDEHQATIDLCKLGDVDAAFIQAKFDLDRATWCDDAQITTGIPIQHEEHRAAGVLLFALDGWVYAMGYGQGHLLIPDEMKDPRFGLSYVARRITNQSVQQLVRRRPGAGRIDSTHLADGASLATVGLEAGAEIVRRLGGSSTRAALSYGNKTARTVHLEGGSGLTTRFAVAGPDFIADVREIARVLDEEPITPGLEVIELLVPVSDPLALLSLEADLDTRLGARNATGIVVVPPTDRLRDWIRARACTLRIGSTDLDLDEVTVTEVIARAALQKDTRRVHELKRGRITLYADPKRRECIGRVSVDKCLEVSAALGSRRFFLTEGHWYELDAAYLAAQQTRVASLFREHPSLDLPAWDRACHRIERDYNAFVPEQRDGYINLDRDLVRNAMASHGRIELCDHLAPDNTFVLVKRASGSKELSHLFAQATVTAKTLHASAEARAAAVKLARSHGRVLPDDFMPKKMVLAILHERGLRLSPQTMLPFSMTALAQTADQLAVYDIDLEVIGIAPADIAARAWAVGGTLPG